MIRSFDLCDGEILINDYLRGGVFSQAFEIGNTELRSEDDIVVNKEEIHLKRYCGGIETEEEYSERRASGKAASEKILSGATGEEVEFCLSLQLLGTCQNVSIETSAGIVLDTPIQNISSQVLCFTLKSSYEGDEKTERQEESIFIHADDFTKVIPVYVTNTPKFVAFFDQSIFCSTWKGIFWNKARAIANEEGVWVDAAVFQECFTCEISTRREKLSLYFDGKTLEADLNSSFYIYTNASGQRYMREGKLWITNDNGTKMINADIFCEEAGLQRNDENGSVYYTGHFVT